MSFDDVRLPEDVEQGAQGGPMFNTQLLTLGSGYEQRNQNWSKARQTFNISYGIQSLALLSAVRQFFYARRGRARGFRFKDWSDFQCVNSPLVDIGGGHGYQLTKLYADGIAPYYRAITRVVSGTLHVYDNLGAATTFTESYGLIVPGGTGPYTATFEFDVPVRFDTDVLDVTVENILAGSVPQLNVVEVLEDTLTLNGY